jgi:hypothetical protein
MNGVAKSLICITWALAGCETAHDVAVTSFRVIDAPANYIRHRIDEESTSTNTTTAQSDVSTPGHPVVASPTPSQQQIASERRQVPPTSSEPSAKGRETVAAESKPSPSPQRNVPIQSLNLPYAKPVPGKPGYVYSPFDPNGGYVDVTGYASGSKAKDPYTGKIFIVP